MSNTKLFRVKIQRFLRYTHLLSITEKLRYYLKVLSLNKKNRAFISKFPAFVLPPADLAFDAYSAPDWFFYKHSGEGTAEFLKNLGNKYFTQEHPLNSIYEWGCGPARVIRHLPSILGQTVRVYGSDYNSETIEWCQKNLPGINFTLNELTPSLLFSNNFFDFIYSISVFTHLSEETGLSWAKELYRVLKPNGILLITTSSDSAYTQEMLVDEKKKYERKGVVVRGQYPEGKKMYLARHSPKYVRERLLNQFEILEHVPSGFPFIEQDYWIVRKK
jgi:ubiquinone/menaquinone biosynthesis C-methylase UbiE